MFKHLFSSLVLVSLAACGGTSETGTGTQGGGSPGGSAQGGAGISGAAGKAAGGDVSEGGSVSHGGSVGDGGSVSQGGTGGGTVDPRCPPQRPMGACAADEDAASCLYSPFNDCLCYRTGSFTYPCPQVDTACGMGGMGGASAAPPPPSGAGGISVKVAVPASQVCSCSAGMWSCTFGI